MKKNEIKIGNKTLTVKWFEYDKNAKYEITNKDGFLVDIKYIEDAKYLNFWKEIGVDLNGNPEFFYVTAAKIVSVA